MNTTSTTNQEAYVQEIERRRQNGELDTAVPTTTTIGTGGTRPVGAQMVMPRAAPATVAADRLRQALLRVRSSLLSPVNEGAISDTLWMDLPCPETVIDFIDSELESTT